ncbi:MAG: DUF2914 domain-containing protein [Candidatus Methylomirabilales bacterium]
MGKWAKAAVIMVVGMAVPILAASQERVARLEDDSLQVIRDVVTTEVVNREPVNDGIVFSASMGPVYYFTEVKGAYTPTHINHIWYYEGQQMAKVPLSIEGPRWRTWSSKRMVEDWAGSWRVEAVDSDGNLLASQTFEVE